MKTIINRTKRKNSVKTLIKHLCGFVAWKKALILFGCLQLLIEVANLH